MVAKRKKKDSLEEYKFYKKLENVLRILFLERGAPCIECSNLLNILRMKFNSLYNVGWCYVAKKEIPDIWKHCLLNDLGIFSEEENKKVVGIIGAFVRYRSLPEVNV